jgi:hypothetical protein
MFQNKKARACIGDVFIYLADWTIGVIEKCAAIRRVASRIFDPDFGKLDSVNLVYIGLNSK